MKPTAEIQAEQNLSIKNAGSIFASSLLRQLILFVVLFAVISTRRLDAITYPQLYAEDGKVWYLDAHNLSPIKSIFTIYMGYFQIYPRIVALLVQPLPLTIVPLVFNSVALATRILPICFLFSSRMKTVFSSVWGKIYLSVIILGVSGAAELHGILTNAHTHLALLSAMILLCAKPDLRWQWRAFDVAVILLSGLSGPFCILLTAVAMLRCYREKKESGFTREVKWLCVLTGVMAACAVIQLLNMFVFGEPRPRVFLGATVPLFFHILSGKVFVSTLLSESRWLRIFSGNSHFPWNGYIAVLVTLFSLGLIARALKNGSKALLYFTLLSAILFCSAVASPLVSATGPEWEFLASASQCGGRYWFFPIIAFTACILQTAVYDKQRWLRYLGIALLSCSVFAVAKDWRIAPFTNVHFRESAAIYDAAPKGAKVIVPEYPLTDYWRFELIKTR